MQASFFFTPQLIMFPPAFIRAQASHKKAYIGSNSSGLAAKVPNGPFGTDGRGSDVCSPTANS